MKRIILTFFAVLAVAVGAYAQGDGKRKLTKEERKALVARMDSLDNARAVAAINDSAFVLEADEVVFKRGYTAHVSYTTNFVAVRGDEAVVQVAFNVPWPGFNGLGGITLEGNITQYEKETDSRGNVYVTMNVTGRGISARLFITLWSYGNKATVNIQQNFHSGKLTLNGTVVPVDESGVFKGTAF